MGAGLAGGLVDDGYITASDLKLSLTLYEKIPAQ
jgi:hypothetical protein